MSPLVDQVSAQRVAVVGHVEGDFINQFAERAPADYVLEFPINAETDGFVGREDVLNALDAFAADQSGGYFEIVAEAGLGKTALACTIAKRRAAIVYLAGAGRGAPRASAFLQHAVGALISRYLAQRATLPAQTADNASVLVRTLAEAVVQRNGEPVWLVVDGLDEVEPAPPGANPLLLPLELPAGVFIVLTRRTGRLLVGPATAVARYEIRRDDPEQARDVEMFIRDRMARDPRISQALKGAGRDPDAFVPELADRCDGSFLYLRFVLADIAERPANIDLERLPDKLVGYYSQYWETISAARQADWELWEQLSRPVLDRLAVAAEPVPASWLAQQVGRSADEIEARVLEPWSRVVSRVDRGGVTVWRLLHRTVAEYLEKSGKIDMAAAHRAVGESYYARRAAYQDWDEYGLRHAVGHLLEAAERSDDARDELIDAAARLATGTEFLRRCLAIDPARVQDDLERTIRAVSRSGRDEATFALAPVVLTLLSFRRTLVDPASIFAAAVGGQVGRSERLLDLLAADLDHEWRTAMQLAIAWLAADAAPAESAALRERARAAPAFAGSPTLARLDEHLGAALADQTGPPATLDPPPDVDEGLAIVARFSGVEAGARLTYREVTDVDGDYLAQQDAPRLVALAHARPADGNRLLREYIELHAAYGYPRYRAGSLRWVLAAVLREGDGARIRPWLAAIGTALLAPAEGEFADGLAIAALTACARLGSDDAAAALARRAEEAIATAARLPGGAGTGRAPPSGVDRASDLWAVHRRVLAALAESAAVRSRHDEARALLDAAFGVDGGFAGYTAPAYLTLAESASLITATDAVDHGEWFETYARRAAENIRDPVHCLRTTARVRALTLHRDPADADPVTRLATDPTRPEFAAVHLVGEALTLRPPTASEPRPQDASTLRDVAELYDRSVDDVVRLNGGPDADADARLDEGSHVHVPDPACPALFAARLAAAALEARDAGAIRRLVPVATADATAASTTLARLVLATDVHERAPFEALQGLGSTEVSRDS